MNPILLGTECLIPMNAPLRREAKNDPINDEINEIENPEKDEEFDFWDLIQRLNWVDREDAMAHANPRSLNNIYSQYEYRYIQIEIIEYHERLLRKLNDQNFWAVNHIQIDKISSILYHIIARGKEVYDAVFDDAVFAIAFIDQACGFEKLL